LNGPILHISIHLGKVPPVVLHIISVLTGWSQSTVVCMPKVDQLILAISVSRVKSHLVGMTLVLDCRLPKFAGLCCIPLCFLGWSVNDVMPDSDGATYHMPLERASE